jgi:MFS family permease
VAIVTDLSLLGDSMLYIVLPIYWEEVGLDSIWQVGILLSINRFIRLPFNPIVGWIYKRISLRTGLVIAVVPGSITTLGYGFFKGFVAWIILRGLWGIAWSFFRIGGLSSVAYYADANHRGEAMGLYNGLYRLGSLFGMLLGGIFVMIIGLEAVSIIFGCFSILGLPLIIRSFGTGLSAQAEKVATTIQESLPTPSMLKHKVIIIMNGFFIAMLFQGVMSFHFLPYTQ